MSGMIQPIITGNSVTIAATTSSQAVALPMVGDVCLVTNLGTTPAFVAFSDSTAVATVAAGFPIPAGQSRMLTIGNLVSYGAAILGSGTGSVVFTRGNGCSY